MYTDRPTDRPTDRQKCYEDQYRLGAVHLLDPGPLSRQRIAVADADHRGFVLLIAVLRVLVGGDVRRRCSREKGEAVRSGRTAGDSLVCFYDIETVGISQKSGVLI